MKFRASFGEVEHTGDEDRIVRAIASYGGRVTRIRSDFDGEQAVVDFEGPDLDWEEVLNDANCCCDFYKKVSNG